MKESYHHMKESGIKWEPEIAELFACFYILRVVIINISKSKFI